MLLPAILITLMYFLSGFSKIFNFSTVAQSFAVLTGSPLLMAKLIIFLVIILEIVAPALIASHLALTGSSSITSKSIAKRATQALAVFTVAATLLYHFPPVKGQYYPFMSNVTALGGLVLLANTL